MIRMYMFSFLGNILMRIIAPYFVFISPNIIILEPDLLLLFRLDVLHNKKHANNNMENKLKGRLYRPKTPMAKKEEHLILTYNFSSTFFTKP